MNLPVTSNGVIIIIHLEHVEKKTFHDASTMLSDALENGMKNRDAIADAFLFMLQRSPGANPSDLWHHAVYRLYCSLCIARDARDPKQSWVRASGEALELAIQRWYAPVLSPQGIEIRTFISRVQKKEALDAMGLLKKVGDSKLDIGLYITKQSGDSHIVGSVHVKASLAERISDDIPASRALMRRGYLSPLWTLDVKSFPPPHGDLVNRGELGTPTHPSEKRKYIAAHGDFDHCYSANTRSVPSAHGTTKSRKRIYVLNMHEQPDQFALDIIAFARSTRQH